MFKKIDLESFLEASERVLRSAGERAKSGIYNDDVYKGIVLGIEQLKHELECDKMISKKYIKEHKDSE